MKKATIGILAHVDAGKTTLAEAMLYLAGKLKKPGRVDHGDTCLDNHPLERERGITIFSQQAVFTHGTLEATLLDTPGHVDFSPEMERTLQVLDYAILVISGTDGVQAHTRTLWRLLELYHIPTFLFLTKMDLSHRTRQSLLAELEQLSANCVDFTDEDDSQRAERLALCRESLLEQYLDGQAIGKEQVASLIAGREVFPCCFGSGLRQTGVDRLLALLEDYAQPAACPPAFSARVFKISHDAQGSRLTHLKLTGGSLSVRAGVSYTDAAGSAHTEKVSQLRLYTGAKFTAAETVSAGSVCAVTGLSATYAGQCLGAQGAALPPVLEPVMRYRILLPKDVDARQFLPKLRLLGEEDPSLHMEYQPQLQQIHVQLMGAVQAEILKSLVLERFGVAMDMDEGHVLYRETIEDTVEGVGHFEPLRHYAEVHLILKPLPRGSGLVFESACREDVLARNWQRLILTHLQEKQHLGVLTGSPITDMKITLAAGRAHLKHTEGGDFRQATWRAVRQGLMQAKSLLLEPVCAFTLQIPASQVGRAINDIRQRHGTFRTPESTGETAILTGTAPVSTMNGYGLEVASYTRGAGHLTCQVQGYAPCHDPQAVIARMAYAPERDTDNPADSVFCAHGAGFNVPWNQVWDYMHLERCLRQETVVSAPQVRYRSLRLDDRELEAIMEREFGPIRRPMYTKTPTAPRDAPQTLAQQARSRYLIVDGYNVIFSWDALRSLAQTDLEAARQQLMSTLCNYSAYTKCRLILVFDAYRVPGNPGAHQQFHNIEVVYTKHNETGDSYIERLVHDIGKNEQVRVVTSDSLIQLSVFRSGVLRMSAGEFAREVDAVGDEIDQFITGLRGGRFNNVGDSVRQAKKEQENGES